MGMEAGGGAAAATKRCPHCAEEIQAAATRCRYCHADFGADQAQRAVERVKTWFGLACLVGMVGLFIWAANSCNEFKKKEERDLADAFFKYRQAASALDKSKPASLQDATKLIGDDPLICRDEEDGAVCQWSFVGAGTIYVHADSKRNGARVRRVETRNQ